MAEHVFSFDLPDYINPSEIAKIIEEIIDRKTIKERVSRAGRPALEAKDTRNVFKNKLFRGFRKWADRCSFCGAKGSCYVSCYGDGAVEMAETPEELLPGYNNKETTDNDD